MKTAYKTLLLLAACGLAACARNPAPRTAGKPGSPGNPGAPSALALLRRHDPKAAWDARSELHADLDQDGVADYALTGLRKDRVVVGIVQGPLAPQSRAWILDFPWGKGTQDSLCSKKVKIELEDVDDATTAGAAKTARPRSGKGPGKGAGKGVSLYDDRCDAFHIYWSPGEKKFAWWRL